jgi:hypothetical protein
MASLRACPFCRKLYTASEAKVCPDCDVSLVPMHELPPSRDALDEDAALGDLTLPEDLELPLLYLGRGRGALLLLAVLGLVSFFLPWVELSMPELVTYSGFDLARGRAGWLWGGATAWLVLIPLVLTRRTITRMRGVRIVTALFAVMTLSEVVMLLLLPPQRNLMPIQLEYRYGLFLSGAISLAATLVAARFGGSLDNFPRVLLDLRQGETSGRAANESSAGETLH